MYYRQDFVICIRDASMATLSLFTALNGMQTRSCDEKSVCRSVCLSVKRVHCDKTEEKICRDFYTM